MVTHTVLCYHCQSENIVKNGIAPNGKQKYRCLDCILSKTAPSGPARKRQSRDDPAPLGYPPERREEILNAYQERSSLRGLSRIFGVARNTVSGWLKKKP